MDQGPCVARRRRKAIVHFQPVVLEERVCDQVALGFSGAHQERVSYEERALQGSTRVHRGNVNVPSGEVFAVEERLGLWSRFTPEQRDDTEEEYRLHGCVL